MLQYELGDKAHLFLSIIDHICTPCKGEVLVQWYVLLPYSLC